MCVYGHATSVDAMSPRTNLHVASHMGARLPGDPTTRGNCRRRKTLHRRGLEKLALNSGTTGGARKRTQNAPKRAPTLLQIVIELNLRHLLFSSREQGCRLSCTTSVNNLVQELKCGISLLWHNWNVQHSVEELNRGAEHLRLGRTA